jgi:predicted transcriptional regulator
MEGVESMANYTREFGLSYVPLTMKYRTSKLNGLRKKYRSDFEIIARVLEAVKENDATRFYIMKRAGINCAQLKRYLGSLTGIGLIEKSAKDGRVFYWTSEKGLGFLKQYYVLLSMLLSTSSRNELVSMGYEAECRVSNAQPHSAMPIATPMQHPPQ